jgi:hypothetical protein
MNTTATATARLAAIASLIEPCPAPDIATGHIACPCGSYDGAWPCPTTKAAWIAHGHDPLIETSQVINQAIAAMRRLDR